MATIPGAAIVPTNYGATVLVYSEDWVEAGSVYGAPPGPDGFSWIIEPGKPKRVPFEVWRFIRDHLGYTSAVEVEVTEEKDTLGNVTGTKYNLDKAKRESTEKLRDADERRFQYWLQGVIEDYVKKSKPVPQPDAAMQRVIDRRGYDLKSYGIVPIGWKEKQASSELNELRESNRKLQEQVAALMKKLEGDQSKKV